VLARCAGLLFLLSGIAGAQTPAASPTPRAETAKKGDPDKEAAVGPSEQTPRFLDTVTVSATLNPSLVRETPGTVSVVDAETIERRLIENAADLVKFEPGVYVESSINRVGLNGFNIRGIGGNRVMTQVDGVETSEQFDFGPFNVHQFGLDLDTLKTAEIVRSAGSSLYGSDALGGVVSFFTKDPSDYLAGRDLHIGGKALYDSRSSEGSGNVVIAGGNKKVQASLFASFGYGHESKNQGEVETENVTRTALNPQDRRRSEALGRVVLNRREGNVIRASGEFAFNDIEVDAFSLRAVTVQGPARTTVPAITSVDEMRRFRASLDQTLLNRGGLDQWSWSIYTQSSSTEQVVEEVRTTTGAGPAVTVNRSGTLNYDQDSFGGSLQGRKAFGRVSRAWLLTFGGSYKHHTYDMLRDRVDVNAATGAVVPTTALILPSKYFPRSDVAETGAYVQVEARLGRLTLVPGVRYDRFSLDADQGDAVFIATLSPAAADFKADAVSSRLGASFRVSERLTAHAQYAAGFRAPPYSAVNSGFTNLLGGYTSVPNPDLDPETSDNFETGLRASLGPLMFGVTGFWNSYENFIDQVQSGVNPTTRLLEFQYQNVAKVKIEGVEFRGEARLASSLRLRASYAVIRGNDVSGSPEVPLNSIAPDQGVVGLEYAASGGRSGGEVSLRFVNGQDAATAGAGFYVPEAYNVLDATGWMTLSRQIKVRAGLLNITNEKYFEWPNVRGRQTSDPAIDRYSSPGISAVASLSIGW
jgi:hemoglobin/transferrin/lactoferrin receptor protein